SERRRRGPDGAELSDPGGITGIAKDTRSHQPGHDLLKEFQPFPAKTVFELHKAGGVAARPGQAVDKPCADRISDTHEHDRQGAGGLLQRRHAHGATGQKDIRGERDQFRRVLALAIDIVLAPAGLDPHIAVAPAQLLQDLPERRYAGLTLWIVHGHVHQHADPAHLLGLLRVRRERPRGRAADERDEIAPFHSITSSARASNMGGMVRPSALAVIKLMTRSNLVGCSTGKSAGFAPRKILSTYSAPRRNSVGKFAP